MLCSADGVQVKAEVGFVTKGFWNSTVRCDRHCYVASPLISQKSERGAQHAYETQSNAIVQVEQGRNTSMIRQSVDPQRGQGSHQATTVTGARPRPKSSQHASSILRMDVQKHALSLIADVACLSEGLKSMDEVLKKCSSEYRQIASELAEEKLKHKQSQTELNKARCDIQQEISRSTEFEMRCKQLHHDSQHLSVTSKQNRLRLEAEIKSLMDQNKSAEQRACVKENLWTQMQQRIAELELESVSASAREIKMEEIRTKNLTLEREVARLQNVQSGRSTREKSLQYQNSPDMDVTMSPKSCEFVMSPPCIVQQPTPRHSMDTPSTEILGHLYPVQTSNVGSFIETSRNMRHHSVDISIASAIDRFSPGNILLKSLQCQDCMVTLNMCNLQNRPPLNITLERELLFSNISDGISQPLVVVSASVSGLPPFCMKFRQVSRSADSAQKEFENLMKLDSSPLAKQLFPKLLFQCTLIERGTGTRWSGIALEMVENVLPLTRTEHNTPLLACLTGASMRHIRRLHSAGFAHGDAHAGNLMYNRRQMAENSYSIDLFCIDCDRLQPLTHDALGALRQWADIQEFLYWSHPLMSDCFADRPHGWTWSDVFAALYADPCVQEASCGTIPPSDYFMDMEDRARLGAFVADGRNREYMQRVARAPGALDRAVEALTADRCRLLLRLGMLIQERMRFLRWRVERGDAQGS